ncbi:hypothetical protein IscW_ISCW001084 [Ixodes scapularis]|uniref:Uncharacterized protein n=1 Tax=Ixodes scapularis TaxID=6945 RepID=B7P122_IXOSC|nr:hypothetical protein IscW_ISCW001084 [Ixodes scapularis]|eukprot:XP_002400031.1 hypothetical protein IscW_ISCW001084 [Ixodes scapularis]
MEGRRRLNSLHIQVDASSEVVPDPFCMLPPFPVPPATTGFGSRKPVDKAALAKRKISVLEKGKVIRPGDESPESLTSPLSPEQRKKTPIRKPSSVFGSAKKYLTLPWEPEAGNWRCHVPNVSG